MIGIKRGYPVIKNSGMYVAERITAMKAREWLLREMGCSILEEPTQTIYTDVENEEDRQMISNMLELPLEYTDSLDEDVKIFAVLEEPIVFLRMQKLTKS